MKDQKVKPEDKIGEYIHDVRMGKHFLNRLQKRLGVKENIIIWVKAKNFHSSKDTIKRIK